MAREIFVCYLPADSALLQKHWLNKIAAWWAGKPEDGRKCPMIHCELFLPNEQQCNSANDTVRGVACGIHYGGTVFFHNKEFSRKSWCFRPLSVSESQFDNLKTWCHQRAEKRDDFNKVGFFCGTPNSLNISTPRQNWFCSQLVGAALRDCNIVDLQETQMTHPESLYVALQPFTYLATVRNVKGLGFAV